MINQEEVNLQTGKANEIRFTDIFDLQEIQQMQDLFSDATGVASIITHPNGAPITQPSNFCRLCNDIIRQTEKGRANCFKSDALIGRQNTSGPIVQPCLSGGLWDAGASISVGGEHIANWLIGQVRNVEQDEQNIINYADEIGANREEFIAALNEVPVMSKAQLIKISKMLFAFAGELSAKAYANLMIKNQTVERQKSEETYNISFARNKALLDAIPDLMFVQDADCRFVDFHAESSEYLYVDPEFFIGKKPEEVLPPDVAELTREKVKEVIVGGQPVFTTYSLNLRGETHHFESRGVPCGDGQVLSIVRDITEQKQSEIRLRQSEEKFRLIAENTSDTITLLDMDFNLIYVSPSVEKIRGFTPEEACLQKMDQILTPDSLKKVYDVISKVLPAEMAGINPNDNYPTVEIEEYHKNGSTIWVELSFSFLKDQNNIPTGIVTVTRDISSRKRVETELEASKARFRQAQKIAQIADWEYNISTGKFIGSDESFMFYGMAVTPNHELDMSFFESSFLNFEKSKKALFDLIENDTPFNEVGQLNTEKGKPARFIHSIGKLIRDAEGKPIKVIGMFQDITERKKTEEDLRESEMKYRSILNASPDDITITDLEGRILMVSPVAVTMFGYNREEEILGRLSSDFIAPEDRDIVASNFAQRSQGLMKKSGDYHGLRKDGSTFDIEVNSGFIRDANGEPVKIVFIIRNITERKKAEEEIRQKNEELQKLNAEKDKFFSIIAHDLKSPFNSIVGFSNILVEQINEQDYEGIEKYANIILQSSQRALDLLSNLMEWSRSQTGRMEFNPEYFDMVVGIKEIILSFDDIAGQKSIVINKALPPNAPVFADKAMISTVFRNLISNAIKFTPSGGKITISANEKQGELLVTVSDTGVGIPVNSIGKLFRIAENFSTPGTDKEQGTGLGLLLCKEFIEKHDGKIWVESVENKGSVFAFTIPSNIKTGK